MKSNTAKRSVSAIFIILLTLPTLIPDTPIMTVYMTVVAVIGVYEIMKCVGTARPAVLIPSFAAALTVPLCRYNFIKAEGLSDGHVLLLIIVFTDMLLAFYLMSLCIFMPDRYDIEKNGFAAFMLIYILAGFQSAVMISEMNAYLVPLIFLAAWGTDVFAWFIGKLFGKHKLAPVVSPNKSVEGAVGGVFGNVFFFCVYALVLIIFFKGVQVKFGALIILAVITSVISQLGDLLLSLVKRKFGIKDFSNIIPGHGGILDRFDSVIPVSLFIFMLYTVIDSLKVFII